MEWPWNRKDPELTAAPEQKSASVDAVDHLVAALPDPILILDSNGIVIKANANAEEMLEMMPVGLHLSQTIRAPAVLEAVPARYRRAAVPASIMRCAAPLRGILKSMFRRSCRPSRTSPAVLLVLKDLTREQQIERMRSDFVANASHELRTPLASLSGFIETLQGAARNDETAREKFLNLMRSQAERMKRLIDDLLSLSRIEMNVHLRPSAKVDLAQVARHVCDLLSGMAQEEKVALQINLDSKLEVAGEWDELVQVVLNLVENAIKYSEPGKTVKIEGEAEAGFVTLSVIDQGRGIAEEHIPAPHGTLLPHQRAGKPVARRNRPWPGDRETHSQPASRPPAGDLQAGPRQSIHYPSPVFLKILI